MTTIVLLTISNIFMTFAWYGHLKYRHSPLFKVILISWLIAFFEYCFPVPANRIGSYENHGFSDGAKPFAMPPSETKVSRERFSAAVGDFTFRFRAWFKRTASLVSCSESSMEFLETRRTIGLTTQRSAVGISRLKTIASTST